MRAVYDRVVNQKEKIKPISIVWEVWREAAQAQGEYLATVQVIERLDKKSRQRKATIKKCLETIRIQNGHLKRLKIGAMVLFPVQVLYIVITLYLIKIAG